MRLSCGLWLLLVATAMDLLLKFVAAEMDDSLGWSMTDVARLRHEIFVRRGLDSQVAPPQPHNRATQLGVQYKVYKIMSIDAPTSMLKLLVWRRLTWVDPRLRWNASEWGGIGELLVYPGIGKEGNRPDDNMWVPALQVYNAAVDIDDELNTGAVWVYPDGTVFQSRPGTLTISCRFTGLVNFPRDDLSCPFDMGVWDYGNKVVNLTLYNGGIELDVQQESGGTTYQEYSITGFSATRETQYYSRCGYFSNLVFRLHFRRPKIYYFWAVEFPGILITVVSFCVFWLDASNCGERLGFGVTLLLAVEVTKIVTNELLPICGEMLWIELLLLMNEAFCVIALIESAFAVYVAFGGRGTVDEEASEFIDRIAQRIIPPLYFLGLGYVYSIRMDDGYLGTTKLMYEGLQGTRFDVRIFIIFPLVLMMVVLLLMAVRRVMAVRVVRLGANAVQSTLSKNSIKVLGLEPGSPAASQPAATKSRTDAAPRCLLRSRTAKLERPHRHDAKLAHVVSGTVAVRRANTRKAASDCLPGSQSASTSNHPTTSADAD